MKSNFDPVSFFPGHDFRKPNLWGVLIQISLEVLIHFRHDMYHSNRLVTPNFWKKNCEDVICTLIAHEQYKSSSIKYVNVYILLFSQGCDKLEHINVSWCRQITRSGVRILSEECSHLESFLAKGCTLVSFVLVRFFIYKQMQYWLYLAIFCTILTLHYCDEAKFSRVSNH